MKKLTLGNYPTPIQGVSHILGRPEVDPRLRGDGKKIWIKREDYSGIELSGNKTRKLEYALAEALSEGAGVVITAGALQSNHCRATVAACRHLGLKPHLMLFGEAHKSSGGNLFLDQLMGAEITYVDPKDYPTYLDKMQSLAQAYAKQGEKAYCIPIGASNGIGNLGFVDAYREILNWQAEQGEVLDAIVCPVGSGGTYAGLWLGHYLLGAQTAFADTKIVGISVGQSAAYFKARVLEILAQSVDLVPDYQLLAGGSHAHFDGRAMLDAAARTITIVDGFQGEGYAVPYAACEGRIQWFARASGIVLDSVYTGKAFHGLMALWAQDDARPCINGTISELSLGKSVLFVHTGGLFGCFGQLNRGGESV